MTVVMSQLQQSDSNRGAMTLLKCQLEQMGSGFTLTVVTCQLQHSDINRGTLTLLTHQLVHLGSGVH